MGPLARSMHLASHLMSLRLRLLLVVLAVAVPAAVATLISFLVHRGVEERIRELGPKVAMALDAASIVGRTCSIEGRWNVKGHFEPSSIEELPLSRRPKLRGEIQAIDPQQRTVTVHGRTIRTNSETERLQAKTPDPLDGLTVGQRIEVSCSVDRQGAWFARKIESDSLKSSDKIKGEITHAAARETGAFELEIHGLRILVAPGTKMVAPRGPLHRMELAGRMATDVHDCLNAAQELLKERDRWRTARPRGTEGRSDEERAAIGGAEDRLLDAREELGHYVRTLRSAAEVELRSREDAEDRTEAEEEIARWLAPLGVEHSTLAGHVARFTDLTSSDLEVARRFLPEVLEPHLLGRILPLVHSYQSEMEEEFSQELQSVSMRSMAAARLAVATLVAGFVLAISLGLLVARKTSRPFEALEAAARRIGSGDLATRVDISTTDEIGSLAKTFNRMAEQLAATTLSIGNLNNVIDSMAAALFLLGPDGKITAVNPAATSLLGYRQEELVGTPFRSICPPRRSELEPVSGDDLVGASERILRTKDGRSIPVSHSGAARHDERGAVSGYVCLLQNLTDRKRLEDDLRRSLAEKELLLQEVHHRVKNNLQVISSLLDMQSRSIVDPQSLEKLQESQDRIRSMVLIHDQLHRDRDVEAVNMRAYLRLLTENLAQAHVDRSQSVQVRTEVEDLTLDLDRALACGLIVNELVSNAFKHAFSSGATGDVLVTCRHMDGGRIAVEVADDGRGLDSEDGGETATSLGMNLVRALTDQLHGRLVRDGARGAAIRVEFPVVQVAEVV